MSIKDSRIIGGTSASSGEFPFAVALTRNGQIFCGGTVYESLYVVTAAHCFRDETGAISFDTTGIEVRIDCVNYVRCPDDNIFQIAQLIPNPAQNPVTNENDILVIKLDRPTNAQPVSLIMTSTASAECPCNEVCHVTIHLYCDMSYSDDCVR